MELKDKQFIIWALDTGTLTKEDLSVKFSMEDIEAVHGASEGDRRRIEYYYNVSKKSRQRRICSVCNGELEKTRNKLARKPVCFSCQRERNRKKARERYWAKKLSTS